ncbi:hypothetical protein INT48_009575, partial [Thamnidium elegans]
MFYPDWSQSYSLPIAFLIVAGSILLTLREFVPDTRLSYSKFATNIKSGKTVGEIITFLAMVIITQHLMILLLQLGSAGYLAARAYNTRE